MIYYNLLQAEKDGIIAFFRNTPAQHNPPMQPSSEQQQFSEAIRTLQQRQREQALSYFTNTGKKTR